MRPGFYTTDASCATPHTLIAKIPHRRIFYPDTLKPQFSASWEAFRQCGKTDASVFREFEAVHAIPGFNFKAWEGGRFAESVVALELLGRRYTCFRACSLFRSGIEPRKALATTKLFEALLTEARLPLPWEVGRRVRPAMTPKKVPWKPRNPDLAAMRGDELMFCEVKWKDEEPGEGQLEALAILRELLKATVEIVRVVPDEERQAPDPPPYPCHFTIA
jgi:hypothetical protein